MGAAFEDRRFVTYLVISNIALIALAFLGPLWCVTGLVAFAGAEAMTALRRRPVSDRTVEARVRNR